MADARKDKRTLLSLKIRYKSATLEDFIERYSSDISRGGVFIKAKKPLAVGTLLKFEFMLKDESSLIHGVGRVVWRREEADASPQDPAGMGIKFIKMDADSRAVVQKIADDRARPGVFDQGKEGGGHLQVSESGQPASDDRTKVRHVSEFLASALEEGGAGEAARREAQAGAARARHHGEDKSNVAARGAFAAHDTLASQQTQSASEAQARGAMSAFGGSGGSSAARVSSAAAPAFDEIDPDDDFLEDETTKIHEYPTESYRPEAAATVIAKDTAALLHSERLAVPNVPAGKTMGESIEGGVQDLFGSADVDSFGPAPGEVIDADFFDSDDGPMGRPVPEAPGIPSEAFKVPQSSEPVWTTRPTPQKQARPGLVILLIGVLVVAGAAVAAWQFGLFDDLMDSLALGSAEPAEPNRAAAPVAAPAVPEPKEAAARTRRLPQRSPPPKLPRRPQKASRTMRLPPNRRLPTRRQPRTSMGVSSSSRSRRSRLAHSSPSTANARDARRSCSSTKWVRSSRSTRRFAATWVRGRRSWSPQAKSRSPCSSCPCPMWFRS